MCQHMIDPVFVLPRLASPTDPTLSKPIMGFDGDIAGGRLENPLFFFKKSKFSTHLPLSPYTYLTITKRLSNVAGLPGKHIAPGYVANARSPPMCKALSATARTQDSKFL